MELEHIAKDVVIERQEVLQLALAESVAGSGDVAEGMSSLEGRRVNLAFRWLLEFAQFRLDFSEELPQAEESRCLPRARCYVQSFQHTLENKEYLGRYMRVRAFD